MLVLTRRMGEEIVIGDNIRVTVVRVEGGKVRLGVLAPRSIPVQRQEVCVRPPSGLVPLETTAAAGITATDSL